MSSRSVERANREGAAGTSGLAVGGSIVELDSMLDDDYIARSWDPGTGLPTRAKLEELGLRA